MTLCTCESTTLLACEDPARSGRLPGSEPDARRENRTIATSSHRPRLAILIDADNIAPARIDGILREIEKHGTPCLKRLYGTNNHLTAWESKVGTLGIEVRAVVAGTNASDLTMTVDAMDLLYANAFDGFCLISSDRHFEPLATRLKRSKLTVYGFGRCTTKAVFRNACDRFFDIDLLPGASPEQTGSKKHTASKPVQASGQNMPGHKSLKKRARHEQVPLAKQRPARDGNPSTGIPHHGNNRDAAATSPWVVRMFRFLLKLAGAGDTHGRPASPGRVSAYPRLIRAGRQRKHLIAVFKQAYHAASQKAKSNDVFLNRFATLVYQLDPGFSSKANGFKKFARLVESTGLFDIVQKGKHEPRIKLKNQQGE